MLVRLLLTIWTVTLVLGAACIGSALRGLNEEERKKKALIEANKLLGLKDEKR